MLPTAVPFVEWFHINHFVSATRALIYLMTLTFDLLSSKQVRGLPCDGLPGLLGLSVVELGRGTRQTDGQTDRQTKKTPPIILQCS